MSSLWTPGGEHPVDPSDAAGSPGSGDGMAAGVAGLSPDDMTPAERQRAEELAREMAAVQEQLASTPAAVVVANHVMGFYELAAIHLSQQPPNLDEAAVAIDAMGGVVEKLPGRLGEAETTLKDALHQIRMVYVRVEQAARAADDEAGGGTAEEGSEGDPPDEEG